MSVAFCPSGRKGLRSPLALRTRTAWETREGSGQHFPRRSPSFAHFLREGSMLFWPSELGRAAAGRRTGRLGELLGTGQRALLTARALRPPRGPGGRQAALPQGHPQHCRTLDSSGHRGEPRALRSEGPGLPRTARTAPEGARARPRADAPALGAPARGGGKGALTLLQLQRHLSRATRTEQGRVTRPRARQARPSRPPDRAPGGRRPDRRG